MRNIGLIAILVVLSALFAPVAEVQGEGRGYITGDTKGDCWYSQIIRDTDYFMEVGVSRVAIMTFDDPTCMRATWANKFNINFKISRPYVQPWVEFNYAEFERTGRSALQKRGYCISATNAKYIAVMIDYVIEGAYITKVMHAGIYSCGK